MSGSRQKRREGHNPLPLLCSRLLYLVLQPAWLLVLLFTEGKEFEPTPGVSQGVQGILLLSRLLRFGKAFPRLPPSGPVHFQAAVFLP